MCTGSFNTIFFALQSDLASFCLKLFSRRNVECCSAKFNQIAVSITVIFVFGKNVTAWNRFEKIDFYFILTNDFLPQKTNDKLETGREPWSSGYGRRLTSWVQIPALDSGWTFFTYIVVKIVMFVWKDQK